MTLLTNSQNLFSSKLIISQKLCHFSLFYESLPYNQHTRLLTTSTNASSMVIFVFTFRFLVIVYPMKARRLCTLSTSRKGLLLVWTLAIVLAAPVLFTKVGTNSKPRKSQLTMSLIDWFVDGWFWLAQKMLSMRKNYRLNSTFVGKYSVQWGHDTRHIIFL